MNKEEEGVLRIVMTKLRLYTNHEVQQFFNGQANNFSNDVNDEDITRIKLTSGIVLRLLNNQAKVLLDWDRRQSKWDFKEMKAIETDVIKRILTKKEENFILDEQNKCIVLRDIMDLDNENAKAWLRHDQVIYQTKKVGENVLKGVRNNESVFDPHRVQARLSDMKNPYMEGLGEEMKIVAEKVAQIELELDLKSLIREKGASEQCKHTDQPEKKNKISIFLPTYNKYQLAVYQFRGINEYNQEVFDQYILDANH